MTLTKPQERIIEAILERSVQDAFSFLMYSCPDCFNAYKTDTKDKLLRDTSYKFQVYNDPGEGIIEIGTINHKFAIKDASCIDKIRRELIEFISIIELLKDHNLIITVSNFKLPHPNQYLNECFEKGDIADFMAFNTIDDLINPFFGDPRSNRLPVLKCLHIFPTSELKDFVIDFRTKTERFNEKSLRSSKKASSRAIIIAVISFSLSIISLVLQIIFTNNSTKKDKEIAEHYNSNMKEIIRYQNDMNTRILLLDKIYKSLENKDSLQSIQAIEKILNDIQTTLESIENDLHTIEERVNLDKNEY